MGAWQKHMKGFVVLVSMPQLLFGAFTLLSGSAARAQGSSETTDSPQPLTANDLAQSNVEKTTPASLRRGPRYRLHPSDTLALSFSLTSEFDQTVTVQPDGYITLRDVGDVMAVNDTLPQVREAIRNAYSKILHDPLISIDLKDFEKPYFVVGGQVGKPGKFEWRSEITLTQAIESAGGLTDASKHSQVVLFRRMSDQWTTTQVINVKKMLKSRTLKEDPVLQPGDMVFVPKNTISKLKPFLPTTGTGLYYNPANY